MGVLSLEALQTKLRKEKQWGFAKISWVCSAGINFICPFSMPLNISLWNSWWRFNFLSFVNNVLVVAQAWEKLLLVGLKSLGTSMVKGKCTWMCWRPESFGMIAIESLISWSLCSSSKLLWLLSHLQVLQRLLLILHSLHKLAVINWSEFGSSSSAEISLVRSK